MQLFVKQVSRGVLRPAQQPYRMPAMKLGSAVKTLREVAGLTTDELADRAGTSKGSISRIENSKQDPSLDMIERIAAALGVKVYQLFAEAEGVDLPVARATPSEADLLKAVRAMEPDARDHYTALALDLARRKPGG